MTAFTIVTARRPIGRAASGFTYGKGAFGKAKGPDSLWLAEGSPAVTK
jgi:hypothetical protein